MWKPERQVRRETETTRHRHSNSPGGVSPPPSHTPGIQDALILRQLSHETWIGPCDASLLLDEVVGFV